MSGSSSAHWVRERVLEEVRARLYPEKPSRLTSCFVCDDEAAARLFLETQCRTGVLYEVEIVDPTASQHVADFNVVQPLPRRAEAMEEIAEHYWNATLWIDIAHRPGVRCAERVTASPIRIRKEL